jgi:hypothetical protein
MCRCSDSAHVPLLGSQTAARLTGRCSDYAAASGSAPAAASGFAPAAASGSAPAAVSRSAFAAATRVSLLVHARRFSKSSDHSVKPGSNRSGSSSKRPSFSGESSAAPPHFACRSVSEILPSFSRSRRSRAAKRRAAWLLWYLMRWPCGRSCGHAVRAGRPGGQSAARWRWHLRRRGAGRAPRWVEGSEVAVALRLCVRRARAYHARGQWAWGARASFLSISL